jgi:hypothetical protein
VLKPSPKVKSQNLAPSTIAACGSRPRHSSRNDIVRDINIREIAGIGYRRVRQPAKIASSLASERTLEIESDLSVGNYARLGLCFYLFYVVRATKEGFVST